MPNAKAARGSVVWAMFLIGFFYLLTTFIGFGARSWARRRGRGPHRRQPRGAEPAEFLGGGAGTFGGDLFLAVIAGVAFATILAVVAGLVLSASAAVSHDVWSNIIRKGKDSEHEEVVVAKIAALMIGGIAILVAVIGGSGLNVSFMVGLAFAVAASANFPALLLALTWRRFNTTGVTGVLFGVISAIVLVIVSPKVGQERTPSPARRSAGSWRTRASCRSRSASSAAGWGRCSAPSWRRAHVPRALRPLGDRAGRGEGSGRR